MPQQNIEIKNSGILVPLALFSSLSWRVLGARIEGLWRHSIFGFNSNFFDWLFENKEILNGSQNVSAKYETAVTSGVW